MADPHWGPVEEPPGAAARAGNTCRARRTHTIRVLQALGILTALGLISAFAVVFIGYQTTDRPDPNADFETATTFVYYNDGKAELGTFAVQNRQPVDLRRDAREHEAGHRRRREPHLLDRQGHLDPRHDPGRLDHRPRRRATGRLDDHPAVHQDPLSHLRPDPDPQVPRALPGVQDQQGDDARRRSSPATSTRSTSGTARTGCRPPARPTSRPTPTAHRAAGRVLVHAWSTTRACTTRRTRRTPSAS